MPSIHSGSATNSIGRNGKRARSSTLISLGWPEPDPRPNKKSKALTQADKVTPVSRINFLDLPTEVRLLIYEDVVDFTGNVIVYAQYELSQEINKSAIGLLHVCRTMREEMKTLFYRNQSFRFSSISAMDNFLQGIGREFASNIRNLQIAPWLSNRQDFLNSVPSLFKWLDGVERLTILHAKKNYVNLGAPKSMPVSFNYNGSGWPTHTVNIPHWTANLSDFAIAILKASGRLAAGKIYYLDDRYQPELHFVPADVLYENAKSIGTLFKRDTLGYDAIVEIAMPDLAEDEELDNTEDDESSSNLSSA